jgi:predicted RNA binding protein YcfA (HicA-like mRNA interferase family)
MSALPVVSAGKCLAALQKAGFSISSQKGSYIKMRRGGMVVIVPNHKTLKPGTLRSIIRQAGLTVDEFIALL